MYIEITEQAFNKLVDKEHDDFQREDLELACKLHWTTRSGDKLMEIYNHVSQVVQYYMQDINA